MEYEIIKFATIPLPYFEHSHCGRCSLHGLSCSPFQAFAAIGYLERKESGPEPKPTGLAEDFKVLTEFQEWAKRFVLEWDLCAKNQPKLEASCAEQGCKGKKRRRMERIGIQGLYAEADTILPSSISPLFTADNMEPRLNNLRHPEIMLFPWCHTVRASCGVSAVLLTSHRLQFHAKDLAAHIPFWLGLEFYDSTL